MSKLNLSNLAALKEMFGHDIKPANLLAQRVPPNNLNQVLVYVSHVVALLESISTSFEVNLATEMFPKGYLQDNVGLLNSNCPYRASLDTADAQLSGAQSYYADLENVTYVNIMNGSCSLKLESLFGFEKDDDLDALKKKALASTTTHVKHASLMWWANKTFKMLYLFLKKTDKLRAMSVKELSNLPLIYEGGSRDFIGIENFLDTSIKFSRELILWAAPHMPDHEFDMLLHWISFSHNGIRWVGWKRAFVTFKSIEVTRTVNKVYLLNSPASHWLKALSAHLERRGLTKYQIRTIITACTSVFIGGVKGVLEKRGKSSKKEEDRNASLLAELSRKYSAPKVTLGVVPTVCALGELIRLVDFSTMLDVPGTHKVGVTGGKLLTHVLLGNPTEDFTHIGKWVTDLLSGKSNFAGAFRVSSIGNGATYIVDGTKRLKAINDMLTSRGVQIVSDDGTHFRLKSGAGNVELITKILETQCIVEKTDCASLVEFCEAFSRKLSVNHEATGFTEKQRTILSRFTQNAFVSIVQAALGIEAEKGRFVQMYRWLEEETRLGDTEKGRKLRDAIAFVQAYSIPMVALEDGTISSDAENNSSCYTFMVKPLMENVVKTSRQVRTRFHEMVARPEAILDEDKRERVIHDLVTFDAPYFVEPSEQARTMLINDIQNKYNHETKH
jgi:hypothetical protein